VFVRICGNEKRREIIVEACTVTGGRYFAILLDSLVLIFFADTNLVLHRYLLHKCHFIGINHLSLYFFRHSQCKMF
jgi:hypothetical protein